MKTSERIMALAENTLAGHRGSDHQEFRAVVATNGYEMSRGGWVTFGGEHVTRGWESFAYMVSQTMEIVLAEPKAIEELEDIEELEAEEIAADEATETEPMEYASTVEVSYLYATRVPTVRLSDMTLVQVLITEDRTEAEVGECESGAALGCLKTGVRRVLPESLLPGSDKEHMIQCVPCFDASAEAYARKLHHYTDEA